MTDENYTKEEGPEEEIVPEEETTESGKIQALKEDLKECKQERKEYLNGWQRAKADLINKKKEFKEEKEKIRALANEKLIEDIIPVLDSFQMAFADTEVWESVDEEWRTGIEHIHTQLIDVLESNGVSIIDPEEGEEFNPEIHEATEEITTEEEAEDNTIDTVRQRGYQLDEKIIRPAHVIVKSHRET